MTEAYLTTRISAFHPQGRKKMLMRRLESKRHSLSLVSVFTQAQGL